MIDAHCHLELYPDPVGMVREVEKQAITTVAVTNLPSHFERGYPHTKFARRVHLALGLHPLYAAKYQAELSKFYRLLSLTDYIGEIGLDFSKEGYTSKDAQIKSFRHILQSLVGSSKFITIHSRRAESDVIDMLEEFRISPAVFHWYTGPLRLIERIVVAGHYFSVNPAMTQSMNGQKVVESIPPTRILTETDGPFTMVDGRPARPSDVSRMLPKLGLIWRKTEGEVEQQIERNFNILTNNPRVE